MDKSYYEAVDKMETMGVEPEYIVGWQGGYLRMPEREEQRVTEAYFGILHYPTKVVDTFSVRNVGWVSAA